MIELVDQPIDKAHVRSSIESAAAGAIVTFDGTVRNHARQKIVTHLFYEAFPPMAVRELEKIHDHVLSHFPIEGLAIVHRLGRIEIGESSVFIAVASAHRGDAFDACRFTIDQLKNTVPIWKKEFYADGEIWVDQYGAG